MVFKASKARQKKYCGVTTRTKRQADPDDQLQAIDNNIIVNAINNAKDEVAQVLCRSRFVHITFIATTRASLLVF